MVAVKVDTAGRHSSEKLVEFVSQSPEETPEQILEVPSMIAETSSAGYIHPQVQLINPTDDDMQLPAGNELGQTQLYEGLVATVRGDPAGGQDQGSTGPPLWAGRWSSQHFLNQFPLEHRNLIGMGIGDGG